MNKSKYNRDVDENDKSYGEWIETEDEVTGDKYEKTSPYTSQRKAIKLTLLKDVTLIISGAVTHEKYVFNGAGSSLYIDELDLPEMLTKNTGRRSCCGSYATPYFEIAR